MEGEHAEKDQEVFSAAFADFNNNNNSCSDDVAEHAFVDDLEKKELENQDEFHEISSSECIPDQNSPGSISMAAAFPDSLDLSKTNGNVREALGEAAQQLIEDINAKRKRDTELLSDFKSTMNEQIEEISVGVQDDLYSLYETQGKIIQEKMQTLFSVLERVAKLEEELGQFKGSLQIFYQDVNTDNSVIGDST